MGLEECSEKGVEISPECNEISKKDKLYFKKQFESEKNNETETNSERV